MCVCLWSFVLKRGKAFQVYDLCIKRHCKHESRLCFAICWGVLLLYKCCVSFESPLLSYDQLSNRLLQLLMFLFWSFLIVWIPSVVLWSFFSFKSRVFFFFPCMLNPMCSIFMQEKSCQHCGVSNLSPMLVLAKLYNFLTSEFRWDLVH